MMVGAWCSVDLPVAIVCSSCIPIGVLWQDNDSAREFFSLAFAHAPVSLYDKMERCKAGKLGNPPCLEYNSTEQYVLLQDHAPNKPRSCLMVPTARVTGIEDSQTVSNQKVRRYMG